jgi:23S rRNA (pseudouridine1915-N3)-methyltransferase
MATIAIISVGKLKTKYYQDACDDYIKRIRRYSHVDHIEVNEFTLTKNPSQKQMDNAKQIEGERLALKANKYDAYYCLDAKGKKYDSPAFSKMLQNDFNRGKNTIAFLIGGSNGLCEQIKKKANGTISFSDMTFAHHLFKVMLLEQIYRSFTILNGEKYHK